MSFRALAALALLLCALAAERCGYYAARSVLMIDLTQHHGLSSDAARAIVQAFTFVAYGSAFVGGGLAFAFGPRVTAVIGAVVAAIGAFCLGGGVPPSVACVILGLGGGIFKACPYAAAAELITDEDGGAARGFLPSPRRFAAYATFAVMTYGAINLGAFLAPLFAGALRTTRDDGGFTSTYAFAGAVDIFAAICAGGALFLAGSTAKTMAQQAHAPYRGGNVPSAPPPPPAPTNDVFVPLTLIGVVFCAMHFALDRAHPDYTMLAQTKASWLFSVNPVVVLLMTVPCGVLFFVLALQRSAVPLTRILGAGLTVFAVGACFALVALATKAGVPLWVLAFMIMAIGEAIAFPLGVTYSALVVRSRAATMVVAGWITLTAMPNYLFSVWLVRKDSELLSLAILALSALAVLVGGILVLVQAVRLHRDLGGHSS